MKIKAVLVVCMFVLMKNLSAAEQSAEYQRQQRLSEETAAKFKALSEQESKRQKELSEQTAAKFKVFSEQESKKQQQFSEKIATWFQALSSQINAWFKASSDTTNAWFVAASDYMNKNINDPLKPHDILSDTTKQAGSQIVTAPLSGAGEIGDYSNVGADLVKPYNQIKAASHWNNEFAASSPSDLSEPPCIPLDWVSDHIPQFIALDKELKELQKGLGHGESLNPMNPRIPPEDLDKYRKVIKKYTDAKC